MKQTARTGTTIMDPEGQIIESARLVIEEVGGRVTKDEEGWLLGRKIEKGLGWITGFRRVDVGVEPWGPVAIRVSIRKDVHGNIEWVFLWDAGTVTYLGRMSRINE